MSGGFEQGETGRRNDELGMMNAELKENPTAMPSFFSFIIHHSAFIISSSSCLSLLNFFLSFSSLASIAWQNAKARTQCRQFAKSQRGR
jgi:hypothetical protein